jgi:hypothetical protein
VWTARGPIDKDSFVEAERKNNEFPSVAIAKIGYSRFRLQQHLGINIPNLEQSKNYSMEQSKGRVAINTRCIPQ